MRWRRKRKVKCTKRRLFCTRICQSVPRPVTVIPHSDQVIVSGVVDYYERLERWRDPISVRCVSFDSCVSHMALFDLLCSVLLSPNGGVDWCNLMQLVGKYFYLAENSLSASQMKRRRRNVVALEWTVSDDQWREVDKLKNPVQRRVFYYLRMSMSRSSRVTPAVLYAGNLPNKCTRR